MHEPVIDWAVGADPHVRIVNYSTTTFTGRFIDINDLHLEDVDMADLLHTLPRIPRWQATTSVPFSVMEHLLYCDVIYCSNNMDSFNSEVTTQATIKFNQTRLDILTHDCHEMYTGDIPTYIKDVFKNVRDIQDKMDIVIRKKLGLSWECNKPCVKMVDMQSLVGEARLLMHPNVYNLIRKNNPSVEIPDEVVQFYGFEEAALEWRRRFYDIKDWLSEAKTV